MKRILASILIICMVLGVAPVTFADEVPAATISADLRDEAEIVKKLGVMPEAILDNTPVTRAEFISYIISILINTQNTLPAGQVLFDDVDASHEHAGAIYHAMKLGLINGSGDGNFNPDNPITWDQAIKIMITAMGFGIQAEDLGGYPSGYLNVANSRKITKGIEFTGTNPLLNKDCEVLLYKALTSPYVKLTAVGDPDNHYSITQNGTWLLDYMNVRRVEGIVKETGKSALLRKSNIKSNQIKVGNDLFTDVNLLGQDLLGYSVIAFAENEDEGELLYILPTPGMNNVLILDAHDLLTDDPEFAMNNGKGCIIYENEDGKRKKAEFGNVDIIYNGVALPGAGIEDLKIKSGSVTLLDNSGDDYSVIIVEEFKTYVVHNVTAEEKAIYSKYRENGQVQKITLAPSDKDVVFKLVDVDQNDITIDKVVPGSVLSVYESKDGSFIRVVCSDAYVSGTVSHTTDDKTIYVDFEPYSICIEFENRIFPEIEIGETYKFYINDRKEIVDYEIEESEGVSAGYLIKSQLRDGAWEKSLVIKFFSAESEFITAEFADKFVLDGEKKVLADCAPLDVAAVLNGADSIFEYVLDEEGKIAEIDFPYITENGYGTDDPDSLRTLGSVTPISRKHYAGVFGGTDTVFIDSSTICFMIPSDKDDVNEYSIGNSSAFGNSSYTVTAFTEGRYNVLAKYLVAPAMFTGEVNLASIGIIASKKYVLDENEVGVEAMSVIPYSGGDAKTYYTEQAGMFAGYEAGDVAYIVSNNAGKVSRIYPMYDRSSNQITATDGYSLRNGLYGFSGLGGIVGKVYMKHDGFISLAGDGEEPNASTTINPARSINTKGVPVFVFDSSKRAGEQLYAGNVNDILDYAYNGEPSNVVAFDQYNQVKVILVVK